MLQFRDSVDREDIEAAGGSIGGDRHRSVQNRDRSPPLPAYKPAPDG